MLFISSYQHTLKWGRWQKSNDPLYSLRRNLRSMCMSATSLNSSECNIAWRYRAILYRKTSTYCYSLNTSNSISPFGGQTFIKSLLTDGKTRGRFAFMSLILLPFSRNCYTAGQSKQGSSAESSLRNLGHSWWTFGTSSKTACMSRVTRRRT